jgi:UDP-2,4-diacetamido-2,4,6-trideoxy-beta-L-altropyranose hydrolase
MRHVVFRADASTNIGTGHVMRCLALATELRKLNATASFICREHPGNLCAVVAAQGFRVERLPSADEQPPTGATGYAAWLGAGWHRDADETLQAVNRLGANPDWLVIDHYALDHQWEQALRGSAKRMLVIDDLADRPHDCDLLLDQNLVTEFENRYDGVVSSACVKLLGPKFTLLQPEYARLRGGVRPRVGPIRRIVIFFGGADPNNLTGLAIEACLCLQRDDIEIDAVVTSGNSNLGDIRTQIAGRRNIHLHTQQPSLAPLFAAADFAIGACGATSWERLCLGVPALVITLAANQEAIADELARRGLIVWLGNQDTVNASIVSKALADIISRGSDTDQSARCLQYVDGKGAALVAALMMTSVESQSKIRMLRAEDETLLLEWANDPVTRRNSFSPDPIPAQTHSKWFFEKLEHSDHRRFYIAETENGVPLGQVRFECKAREWEVHYLIAPLFRRRGLGASVLKSAMSELAHEQGAVSIVGRVKNDNHASRKIFESLGFRANAGTGGDLVYQLQI